MKKITAVIAVLMLGGIGAASPALAQNEPPPPFCENNAEFQQWDFWLGTWDVFNNANGNHAGINRIEKVESGCLIMEHWTSDNGGTGRSINYYDAVTGKWRQVWVANGYSIDYTGGLNEAGEMALTGEIHGYRPGTSSDFRGTWTLNDDGSVRQFFEQYNAEKEVWNVWFDGKYVKRGD